MGAKTGTTTPDDGDSNDAGEIVYTELNLEKWSIWEPSSSPKAPRARIIERQRILNDGSHVTAKVEIGFTQHGNLSTRDQRIYYVLFKLWDEAGRPDTPVTFSLQKMARELGEEWGSKSRRSIIRSLLQLRGVLFVWENSYFDKSSGHHIELLDTFNILSELSIARRTKKLHATTEMCLFQFHRAILNNLHANHTTPLFLATVLSFKSEIAQMLYPRLDLLLADKKQYERRTKELFEDLGLEAETYRYRSARKRVIERALEELQGAPLTTGSIVSATVEPTKDNTDFKIVIQKGPRRKSLAAPKPAAHQKPEAPKTAPAAPLQTSLFAEILPRESYPAGAASIAAERPESEEALLVRYFHQSFHGAASKGALSPKELIQAARLIEQHGVPQARALVDYAKIEAPKTKYIPASLNGILQYEGRFAAEGEERARAQQVRGAREAQQKRTQEAQAARQGALEAELRERVGWVKNEAPGAFSAFLRQVEAERAAFLETPIARQAKPETRDLLSRTYAGSAKRLEIFIEFFRVGSEGEALLSPYPPGRAISQWLQNNRESAQRLVESMTEEPQIGELLR